MWVIFFIKYTGESIVKLLLIIFVLLMSGCVTSTVNQTTNGREALTAIQQQIVEGNKALTEGVTWQAIENYDEAIRLCEEHYKDSKAKIYTARGVTDNFYYLLVAANNKQEAVVVSPECSDVHFYRGYSSIEVGDVEMAEMHFSKAVDYAPVNALYLVEYGHVFHIKKEWQKALEIFKEAELAAQTYSPEDVKIKELTRAKRGIGFSLIELGRLDEAEAKFKECLDIDPNDEGAKIELAYINQLRDKVKN